MRSNIFIFQTRLAIGDNSYEVKQ